MTSAEHHPEPLDLVINADGSGIVDASQLARLGLQPGTHLRVVPDEVTRGVDDQRGAEGRPRRELSFIGSVKGGPRDMARNTDKYLAGFGE
jgi:hypothetical protein